MFQLFWYIENTLCTAGKFHTHQGDLNFKRRVLSSQLDLFFLILSYESITALQGTGLGLTFRGGMGGGRLFVEWGKF
jgi:hypothetical protein